MKSIILKTIIENIVCPKNGERILFITDTAKKKIAFSLFNYCVKNGYLADLIVTLPTNNDGEEPSEVVALACKNTGIIMALTKWSMTHTKPLQEAKKNGAKIITFPAVTEDMLERCVPVDYQEMEKLTKLLAKLISNKGSIKITSKAGTDLTISTKGFTARPMYGLARKGFHMNLPDGETSIGVTNANGLLVVDGSMPPDQPSKWGKIGMIKTPIKLSIRGGFVEKVEGGKEAKVLSKILKFYGKKSYKIAELGIGANPKAKIGGNVTEDEKVLGTIHVALGNNTGLGGSNYVPVHLDGVVRKPTVKIGNIVVFLEGKHNSNNQL